MVLTMMLFTAAQVLVIDIPPGISGVDCDGTEASLLDCTSTAMFGIQAECSVARSPANDATVLACGAATPGARTNLRAHYCAHQCCT